MFRCRPASVGERDGRGVGIPDLNATIGWAVGLPVDEQFATPSGERFRIAEEGQPVIELFSSKSAVGRFSGIKRF